MKDSPRGGVELGEFRAPMLIFGGTYGNLEATKALLAEAERLDIPPARMIHTGDVVAYCADAKTTTDLIRDAGIAVVMGNCEEALGADASDCGCGFAEGGQCDLNAKAWYGYCAATLDAETKRWMAGLPRRIDFSLSGMDFSAVHGAPSQINKFVFGSTESAELAAELGLIGERSVVSGHSGIPFVRAVDSRLWINAGALGMPANDGTPRVWYALLSPGAPGRLSVELRSLTYNWPETAQKMRAVGLPEGYAKALETGFWDSCEILPEPEAQATGKPLKPFTFRYNRALRAA